MCCIPREPVIHPFVVVLPQRFGAIPRLLLLNSAWIPKARLDMIYNTPSSIAIQHVSISKEIIDSHPRIGVSCFVTWQKSVVGLLPIMDVTKFVRRVKVQRESSMIACDSDRECDSRSRPASPLPSLPPFGTDFWSTFGQERPFGRLGGRVKTTKFLKT